jgi:uroporphyrinogen-III synthase
MSLPLAGVGVLVTRPAGQAASLIQSIQTLGGSPVAFPALAILQPRDPAALERTIGVLDRFHLAIFISPTAAERGLAAVLARRTWPAGLRVASVGKGTAAPLQAAGLGPVLAPGTGADSEHLLALPELQAMAGRHVVIFRGEGGRDQLADTLATRGAQVSQVACYRRARPETDPGPALAAFREGRIQAVTVFSGETLDHLFQMLGEAGRRYLENAPLFAPHPRIAHHAQALGVARAITTEAGEQGVIRSLVEYFGHG